MFGVIRPCRNRLGDDLAAAWLAHLCGMCLSLRDRHGHAARLVTNYDAVVVSALVEAQTGVDGGRRTAGPCALRGMRRASVATGVGADLAAAASLVLASAKVGDHLADGDTHGAVRRVAATAVGARWAAAGAVSGAAVGLDVDVLTAAIAGRSAVELPGRTLLEMTGPTEQATSLVFAHTAEVAGRPANRAALTEIGRLFGRVAHLLDAVEDLAADRAAGHFNPIDVAGASPAYVRSLLTDALLGIRLAVADLELVDGRLVHTLLVHELPRAVRAAMPGPPPGAAPEPGEVPPGGPPPGYGPGYPPPPPGYPPGGPPPGYGPGAPPPGYGPGAPPPGWAPGPAQPGSVPGMPVFGWPVQSPPPQRRNPVLGCLGWLVACGTCQVCCRGSFDDPCTGEPRRGWCRGAGCDPDCSECCGECVCDGCCDCACDC